MQAGRFSTTIAIAATAIALGASGCSGDEEQATGSQHPAATAVRDLQEAFENGDMAAVCEQMTRAAREQAVEIGGGDARDCERGVKRVQAAVRDTDGEQPVIARVQTYRSQAVATAALDGWKTGISLAREDARWKLAGFFGMAPADFKGYEERFRSVSTPGPGIQSLEVFDGTGKPCPYTHDIEHPAVTGGCRFRVFGTDVPIRILTPFGPLELAECSVDYRIAIAPPADTWMTSIFFDNPKQPQCAAMDPCVIDGKPRPWNGQLRVDGAGGYLHHMVMCLRTGMGSFGGFLVMRLLPDGDGWRVEGTDKGDSGFIIDGELAVGGEPFEIRKGS